MAKKLCKRIKEGQLVNSTKKYSNKVNNPKFVCLKCGRVANKKSLVCEPSLLLREKHLKE